MDLTTFIFKLSENFHTFYPDRTEQKEEKSVEMYETTFHKRRKPFIDFLPGTSEIFSMQNANYPNIMSPNENKNNLKVEINFSYSLIKQVLIYLIIIYVYV